MNNNIFKIFMTLGILLSFAAVIFPNAKNAEAAKIPEIIWAEELLLVSNDTNPLLVTGGDVDLKGYKKRITDALTVKLHAARDAGKLPFTLKEDAETYEYEGVFDDVSSEVPVALIPLAIMSDSLHVRYDAGGKKFYKTIVMGSLYLAICKGGSTSNNWTMIGGIPLSGYTILGDDINHPLTNPTTKKEEAEAYVDAMEKVINSQLDFANLKKHLQNLNSKKAFETFEVMEVELSSKKAAEIFGSQKGKIQTLLGTFYTTKFQATSKAVVYPPIAMTGKNTGGDMSNVGNQSAADDVSDTLYVLHGGKSHSGATMTLSMPEPMHKINLNFAGAAWQELQNKKESEVVKNIGYKALLKMNIDGKNEKSVDDVKSVQYIIPQSGSIDELQRERLADIYTELLIRLADMLGSKK